MLSYVYTCGGRDWKIDVKLRVGVGGIRGITCTELKGGPLVSK